MAYIRTFKNIQDEVLALLDEAGDTSTTLTLVKNAIRAAHEKRVTEERWSFMLWETPLTFVTVPSQQYYSLHAEFFRPLYFRNRDQKDFMTQYDEATIVASGADWVNDHDAALAFVLWGRTQVSAQPSAASVLTVASDSNTDNGARSLIVRGDTVDGVRSETIPCGSNGIVQFTRVINVTKVGIFVGKMTLSAGATTLLTLFPEEPGRSHQRFFLIRIPDTAETVEYMFYRQPSPLSNDNDITDVPPPFDEILVYDTLLALATYNQYDPETLSSWTMKREDLLLAMRQSYTEQARALEAAVNYTTYVPR